MDGADRAEPRPGDPKQDAEGWRASPFSRNRANSLRQSARDKKPKRNLARGKVLFILLV
jgi:hypothetical protein